MIKTHFLIFLSHFLRFNKDFGFFIMDINSDILDVFDSHLWEFPLPKPDIPASAPFPVVLPIFDDDGNNLESIFGPSKLDKMAVTHWLTMAIRCPKRIT